MGLGKRLIDLARANLNALLDRTAAADAAMSDLSDEDIQAELSRRQTRRLREEVERSERQKAERGARERAEARAKQQGAARKAPPSPTGAEREAASARSARAATAPRGGDKRIRELYAQLEVPYGAGIDEVKKSFRRLMRKYHPDLHLGDPKKHQAATKLTMTLTEAYRELERHLGK